MGDVRAARRYGPAKVLAGLGVLMLTVAGCTSPEPEPSPMTEPSPSPSASVTPEPSPSSEEPPALAWGPTEEQLAEATEIAAGLSDAEVAGQVIIARYSGTDPGTPAALVRNYDLAGVILFSDNVASLEQVQATAEAVQDAHAESGRDWPAVVSVDNEGGTVQRMSSARGPWTSFPDFAAAGAAVQVDSEAVREAARAMATELRASGVTMNFAPVADVSAGAADPTINVRGAGSDPAVVSDAVVAAVEGYGDGGVLTSIKHFPGHGGLGTDSHHALPVQDAEDSHLHEVDLPPFTAGIEAGAPMVMMGHIAVDAWDPQVPASLSGEAYRVLREDLGFTGVAITDGLGMGALTSSRTAAQIAVEALAAGADLLLTPGDVDAAHTGIVTALAEGDLDRDRLDEAAGRVIAMQTWQEHLAQEAGPVSADDVGSAAAASQALSAAAMTVVSGECSGPYLGERIHVRGGTPEDWEAFVAAASDAGLDVAPQEEPADTVVRLFVRGSEPAAADVAVALDGPWLLAGADAPTRIAAYGRTAGTMAALVQVLTGQADPPGRLPFESDDLSDAGCGG